MSFLDSLKHQVEQGFNNTVSNAATNASNQSKTIRLSAIPTNLEQLKVMPEASLTDPYAVAALTVAVLSVYPISKDSAIEMLNYLRGPRPLSPYDISFLNDRFRDKDYVPRSYFEGSTPANNYEPSEPYSIVVFENPHSRDNFDEGYINLYIRSGGADSPRSVKLRTKPSTGQWFLWEQFLLSDIRIPVAADPWA